VGRHSRLLQCWSPVQLQEGSDSLVSGLEAGLRRAQADRQQRQAAAAGLSTVTLQRTLAGSSMCFALSPSLAVVHPQLGCGLVCSVVLQSDIVVIAA
jgi:hypothetical protein